MRRIVLWAMSTLTVLVLLFSYNTSRSSSATQVTAQTRSAASNGQTAAGSSSSSASSSSVGSSSSSSAGTATTVTGNEAMTRYGVVQVQITVENGKITSSTVLQVPWNDRHDQMINSSAVPVYNQEAVAAQSSGIDVVSGATVTWQGYTESLQSAIDQAHL